VITEGTAPVAVLGNRVILLRSKVKSTAWITIKFLLLFVISTIVNINVSCLTFYIFLCNKNDTKSNLYYSTKSRFFETRVYVQVVTLWDYPECNINHTPHTSFFKCLPIRQPNIRVGFSSWVIMRIGRLVVRFFLALRNCSNNNNSDDQENCNNHKYT
jgi:hypothetical protein